MLSKAMQGARQSSTVRDIVRRAKGRNPDKEELREAAVGFFGNFPKNIDLQDALNTIQRVEREFSRLPPLVRQRFGQRPLELIEFIRDEGNFAEAARLGLIEPAKVIERQKAVKAAEAAKTGT